MADSEDMRDKEHQTEKEKLSQLHGKAKAEYILEYYKGYFIAAILAVIAVFVIINWVDNAKKESKFGMAVLNASYTAMNTAEEWQNRLDQAFGFGKYEYSQVLALNYPTGDQITQEGMAAQEKLLTMVAAQQIDMFLAPEDLNETFQSNASYFLDLSSYLPEDLYDKLEEEGRIITLTDSEGETFPALISLTPEEVSAQADLTLENPTIGIVGNSVNKDNSIQMLRWLLGLDEMETTAQS